VPEEEQLGLAGERGHVHSAQITCWVQARCGGGRIPRQGAVGNRKVCWQECPLSASSLCIPALRPLGILALHPLSALLSLHPLSASSICILSLHPLSASSVHSLSALQPNRGARLSSAKVQAVSVLALLWNLSCVDGQAKGSRHGQSRSQGFQDRPANHWALQGLWPGALFRGSIGDLTSLK